MQYQIGYLDTYGNAEILAEKIEQYLPLGSCIKTDLAQESPSSNADGFLICFEMTREAVPLEIMEVLESLEGKRIALFVLCAAKTESEKQDVERRILPFLPDDCDYVGMFTCLGQMPSAIQDSIEEVFAVQPENPQAKTLAQIYSQSLGHPNEDDFSALRKFLQSVV